MKYLRVQIGLTVVLSLLRWSFIWTKSTETSAAWDVVNNLFWVAVISWLFSLGRYLNYRDTEKLEEQLEHEKQNVRISESNYYKMEKRLTARIDELIKEKERFFTIVEKMSDSMSLRQAPLLIKREIQEAVEKERSVMSNFI